VAGAAAVPAAYLAALGLVLAVLPVPGGAGWFFDGDNPRHVVYAAETWADGSLGYARDPYPRGWHAIVATLWSAGGGAGLDPDGVERLVGLMASAIWFVWAALALATGLLTAALGRRLGVKGSWAVLAPLGAGACTLSVGFLAVYLANGYENSVLAALLLAAAAYEVVARCGSLRALVVAATAAALMCHVWQLLLPPAALALAVASWAHLRLVRSGHGRGSAGTIAACVVAGAVLVGAPGLAAVVSQTGIDHAVEAGVVAPLPHPWVALSLVAALWLAVARRRDLPLLAVAGMVLGTAVTALLLAALLDIPPTRYYPSKTLWQAALLGVPLVWAGGAAALSRLGRRVPAGRPATVAGGLLVALAVAWWLVTPVAALTGSWSTVRASRVLATVTAPGAAQAQVVWTGDREDDTIGRILLDVYRVELTRDRAVQEPMTVEQECAVLAAADRPTVLSDRPSREVAARYACVPGVRTIAVTSLAG
jgi:hypothetical protein